MCGKAAESDASSNLDAAVMKVSSSGAFQWGWRSNLLGANDVCNGLAQLPSGGDILMAGYQTVNDRPTGCIMKLSLSAGAPGWTSYALFPTSSTNSFSALESVSVSSTYGVLVPGIYNIPTSDEMNFHSYGNGMLTCDLRCVLRAPCILVRGEDVFDRQARSSASSRAFPLDRLCANPISCTPCSTC